VQAAQAQVGLDARAHVLKLVDDYPTDPRAFQSALEAGSKAYVAKLPPDLQPEATKTYELFGSRGFAQVHEKWKGVQIGRQRATIGEAIDAYTADSGSLAYQGDGAGTLETFAKAKDQIDAGVANGVLTPEEGQRSLAALHEQSGMSYLRGLLERAPDPDATVRGLKEGKTGDEVGDAILGTMPMEKRFALISKAEVEAKDRRLQSDADFRNQFNQQIATDPLGALETAKNYDKQNRAREYGAMASVENATGDPTIVSGRGAVGRMQVEPGAARDAAKGLGLTALDGLSDDQVRAYMLAHPDTADQLGRTYYDQMLERFDGNRTLARAAYNAGPTTVEGWIKKFGDPRKGEVTDGQFTASIPYEETRGYVVKVANALGPEDKTAGLAIKSAMGQAAKAAQADLYERQKGELTSRANGAPPENPVSEAEIRQAYPGRLEGDKAVDRWRKSAAVADAAGALPGTSLQDRQTRLAALRPTDTGDTEGWERYDAFFKAVQADNAKLLEDPGAYALAKSPRVQQAFAASASDPAQLPAAIGQSLAYQEHMGLTPEQAQPLPKELAGATVGAWHGGQTAAARLAVLAPVTIGLAPRRPDGTTDDTLAAKVLQQLEKAGLDKGTNYALEAARAGDLPRAHEIIGWLAADPKALPDPGEAKAKDVKSAVARLYTQPNAATAEAKAYELTGQPGAGEAAARGQALLLRGAMIYAARGEQPDDAAAHALRVLYGDKPVTTDPELGIVPLPPGVTDAQGFENALSITRENLDLTHLAPTREGVTRQLAASLGRPPVPGEVEGALAQATREHDALAGDVRNGGGRWLAAPGGFQLITPHGQAVPGPDGKPRIWTADEIQHHAMTGGRPPREVPLATDDLGRPIPGTGTAPPPTVGTAPNPFAGPPTAPAVAEPPKAEIEPSNIDPRKRPVVPDEEGNAAVLAVKYKEGGNVVLVPTVTDEARVMSDAEAVKAYEATGKHLGKYRDEKAADAALEKMRQDRAAAYRARLVAAALRAGSGPLNEPADGVRRQVADALKASEAGASPGAVRVEVKNEYPGEVKPEDRASLAYGSGNERFVEGGIKATKADGSEADVISIVKNFVDLQVGKGPDGVKLRFVKDDAVGGAYARALAAIPHAPVAALGFDPRRTMTTSTAAPTADGGMTDPDRGGMWVDVRSPSSIVHESLHNGLARLMDSPDVPKAVKGKIAGLDEETLVRAFMHKHFGDIETDEGRAAVERRGKSAGAFDRGSSAGQIAAGQAALAGEAGPVIDLAEAWAQKLIARRKPGGPR
jgi:hypothetical protein